MTFTCPHCQQSLETDDGEGGKSVQCPSCGRYILVPLATLPPTAKPPPSPTRTPQPVYMPEQPIPEVRVVDVKMPFWSMVVFMIKWAIAAIPAMIILGLVYLLVVGSLLGGCSAMMMQ